MEFIFICLVVVIVIGGLWWITNKLSKENVEVSQEAANDSTFAEAVSPTVEEAPVVVEPTPVAPVEVVFAVAESKPAALVKVLSAVAESKPVAPVKAATRAPAKPAQLPKKGKKQATNGVSASKAAKKPVSKPVAKKAQKPKV